MVNTVSVTGGNGTIGRAILKELNEAGYETVNISRGKRSEGVSDRYRSTDLLTSGEVYDSLARDGTDAVIHMGSIPGPKQHPAHVTYESNVMGAYHVLQAAADLDIDRVCLGSSINAMGACHGSQPNEVEYLPVDESHTLDPDDPYSIGKQVMELTADGFGRQNNGMSIASLRYPGVLPEEELWARYRDPPRVPEQLGDVESIAVDDLFTYLDLRDAARAARKAIEVDLGGHETFFVVAADTTMDVETDRLIERYYPDAVSKKDFTEYEALVDSSKARELLDWTPRHTWRGT